MNYKAHNRKINKRYGASFNYKLIKSIYLKPLSCKSFLVNRTKLYNLLIE